MRSKDGRMTTNWEKTINTILDVLIIKDDKSDEDQDMKEIRRQYNLFDLNKNKKPNEPETILIEVDLRDIIDSFQKNKAPGIDKIKINTMK